MPNTAQAQYRWENHLAQYATAYLGMVTECARRPIPDADGPIHECPIRPIPVPVGMLSALRSSPPQSQRKAKQVRAHFFGFNLGPPQEPNGQKSQIRAPKKPNRRSLAFLVHAAKQKPNAFSSKKLVFFHPYSYYSVPLPNRIPFQQQP